MINTPVSRILSGLLFTLCLAVSTLQARVWHVSGVGDDANPGASEKTAFRTLKKAASVVQPGDTVLLGNGTYTDDNSGADSAVLVLTQHGSPDKWTIWKAAPGARPEIIATKGWHAILITGSYYVIDGITLTGGSDSIVMIEAYEDSKIEQKDGRRYWGAPRFNTNALSIDGRKNDPAQKPHHIIVRNCVVSKFPGGGIGSIEADYITIEDNIVFDNSWFSRHATSGMGSLWNWAHDDKPGYHMIFQRNILWNNKTLVPWTAIGKHSDGNGIIVDVTDGSHHAAAVQNTDAAANPNVTNATPAPAATPAATTAARRPNPNAAALNPLRPKWEYRTLIANNISAFNGGSGIHTFRARHVDIINNTTYWNGGIVGYQELFANRSVDIVILNNIIVPRPGGRVTSNNRNEQIVWDYNLYPVEQSVVKGPNDIVADPMFVKVARDLRDADFRLKKNSPALHSGTVEFAQPTDLKGKKRPAGKSRDRGAYEQ